MKKVLIILFILMLIISVFQIGDMYAKYIIEKQGDYERLLGVWSIKLNDIDISSGESMDIELTEHDIVVDTNYVVEGKIAPGVAGHFDLLIDPTGTDVAVIYEINIKTDQINQSQYKITSISNTFKSADGQETITNTQASTNGTVHKAIIPLDKVNAGYINDIRINFEWANLEANNAADTIIGSSDDSMIIVPIQVDVKQYMAGDTL